MPTSLAESIEATNAMDILFPACPGPNGKGFLGSWKGADDGGTARLEWSNNNKNSFYGLCFTPRAFGLKQDVKIDIKKWPADLIMQAGATCGLSSTTQLIPRETLYEELIRQWEHHGKYQVRLLGNNTETNDLECLILQIEKAYQLLHELRNREKAAEIKTGFLMAAPFLSTAGFALFWWLGYKYLKHIKQKNIQNNQQNPLFSFLFKMRVKIRTLTHKAEEKETIPLINYKR